MNNEIINYIDECIKIDDYIINYVSRINKIERIIDLFFKENIYYYNNTTSIYFHYKLNNFTIINENELLYNILSYISKYRNIFKINTNLKEKIKNKIHKIIKTKTIYENIPNSECLQNILSFFYPNFFTDKEYAKYFLITIGDIIMKKTKQIYFVPLYLKPFLISLNKYISLIFNSINILHWFKFKYNGQDNILSRVFKMNNININYFVLNTQLFINIICVSIHYSHRYLSGEIFLSKSMCLFKNDVLLLNKISKKELVDLFLNDYIIFNDINYIHKNDMIYIWNSYISNNNIINICTNNELIKLISDKINLKSNYFIGVTSIYLPYVINFKEFWNTYISYEEDDEYEISELLTLYSTIYKDKITYIEFKNLIRYYNPHVNIIKDKNIINIKCSLWDKKEDILLYNFKNININDLYKKYCNSSNKYKVSKNYFIKYIK